MRRRRGKLHVDIPGEAYQLRLFGNVLVIRVRAEVAANLLDYAMSRDMCDANRLPGMLRATRPR
jgi:hypothetical protein